MAFEDLPDDLKELSKAWSEEYGLIHEVAHWDDEKRKRCSDYEDEFERAAKGVEHLLATLPRVIMPHFAEAFPTIIWEDHDECLEVRPEDIEP